MEFKKHYTMKPEHLSKVVEFVETHNLDGELVALAPALRDWFAQSHLTLHGLRLEVIQLEHDYTKLFLHPQIDIDDVDEFVDTEAKAFHVVVQPRWDDLLGKVVFSFEDKPNS